MNDESVQGPEPEQLHQELAELRQSNSDLRQQRAVEQAAQRLLREHVLAMRTSEDLYSVAAAFLVEVRHLGIDTLFLAISFFEGRKIVHHYPVTVNYASMGLKLRNENDPAIKKLTNEALIRYFPPDQFDQLPEHLRLVLKQSEIEMIRTFQTQSVSKIRNHLDGDAHIRNDWTGPESNLKQAIAHISGEWIRIHIPFSQGVVSFNSRTDDDQQVETVALLAEIFSLGYVRFLDFERLEQQIHQARLEAAVQRVRAEATAMQQSSDVLQVMIVLWQGLEEMIPLLEWCSLNIQDQEADVMRLYMAIKLSGGVTLAQFPADKVLQENLVPGVHLLGSQVPLSFVEEHKHGWAHREREASVVRIEDTAYQKLKQSFGAELAPGAFAGHSAINMPFGHGGLFVKGTEAADFDREEVTILEAFADAVTLGYTRFLDLQRLEQQTRDLEVALQEKEQAQEALIRSESLAAIGTLVAGAAHELNNPIGTAASLVQSVQEMIGEDSIEELQQDRAMLIEHLAFSHKELNRAKDIVASLLGLSRQSQNYTEEVDFNSVAQDALRVLHNKYKRYEVDLVEDYQVDLPTVLGNFAQLGQVVLNLIENAVEALGEEEGQIRLRTYTAGDQVVFECRDTGPGLSEAVRQDIFKPFFTTKAPGEGTGLGLYICHQIIDKHGGRIEVESAEGKGTTFWFGLPRVPVQDQS